MRTESETPQTDYIMQTNCRIRIKEKRLMSDLSQGRLRGGIKALKHTAEGYLKITEVAAESAMKGIIESFIEKFEDAVPKVVPCWTEEYYREYSAKIADAWEEPLGVQTMWELTGYGQKETCLTCQAAAFNCDECIHWQYNVHSELDYGNPPCMFNMHSDKYDEIEATETAKAIQNADTPRELVVAARLRAAYLYKILMKAEEANHDLG